MSIFSRFSKPSKAGRHDENGCERLDPTPVALPVAFKRPPTIQEQIAQMIRSERLRQAAEAAGYETFEESEDFDVDDDFDPKSPWEIHFDPSQQRADFARFKQEQPAHEQGEPAVAIQTAKDGSPEGESQ